LQQLLICGAGHLAVMLSVNLCCFGGVMGSVMKVAVGRVGVVRGQMVVTGFVMTSGFAMMPRGVFVVFRCFVMMLGCFFGHRLLLAVGWSESGRVHKAEPVTLRQC
jgi:hypothetical protein